MRQSASIDVTRSSSLSYMAEKPFGRKDLLVCCAADIRREKAPLFWSFWLVFVEVHPVEAKNLVGAPQFIALEGGLGGVPPSSQCSPPVGRTARRPRVQERHGHPLPDALLSPPDGLAVDLEEASPGRDPGGLAPVPLPQGSRSAPRLGDDRVDVLGPRNATWVTGEERWLAGRSTG